MHKLEDFSARSTDKLRYGDTDRQGHVNNAVFASFFETGRVELFIDLGVYAGQPTLSFVIARIVIDYRQEILWPGGVACGTAITQIGNSSITITQTLFQNDALMATAESVVVQIDNLTHRPMKLGAKLREGLHAFILPV